jgi:hypothetical protein
VKNWKKIFDIILEGKKKILERTSKVGNLELMLAG